MQTGADVLLADPTATPRRLSCIVPMDLREAAYALGVPKWKTIVRIVLPTARPDRHRREAPPWPASWVELLRCSSWSVPRR